MFYQLRGMCSKKRGIVFLATTCDMLAAGCHTVAVQALLALRERSFDRLADGIQFIKITEYFATSVFAFIKIAMSTIFKLYHAADQNTTEFVDLKGTRLIGAVCKA